MDNEEYATNPIHGICRDQLVTVGDLHRFKEELLVEIHKLLPGNNIQLQKKWLKTKDVRKLLSLSSGSIQNLRINGTLPFKKVGGVIYYNAEDVDRMMKKDL